jgi:divalent metal cation (Fe/Co/Zn/Cd) transporter
LAVPALFLPKLQLMEMKKRNKGLYWILFLISFVAFGIAIFTHWPWLTLIIPFVTTFFVLAMDII